MKFIKRLTSLAIVLALVLTSLCAVSISVSAFSDVDENNPYSEAIDNLVANGIINGYEDGTFKPDNTITRAEFAKLLAVASAPTGQKFEATTTQFTDMPDMNAEQGWAIPYISYAVSTKAINGNPDGTFKPANPVTYGEAVKMIVCTLGYGPVVDTTLVPWYQGYLDISKQIGLNKGAMSTGDAPAPRGLVAQLIYNMQSCRPLVQTGTDANGNPTYGQAGKFEEEKDNATIDEGIVMGYTDYSLDATAIGRNKVQIDDEIYSIGNVSLESVKALIGKRVSFSYNESGSTPELVKLSEVSGYNSIVNLEPWQIDALSANGLEYFADENAEKKNQTTNAKFASDFYVVYNGMPVDPADIDNAFITTYFDVDAGSIKLLSNDGTNNTFEVAFVENYETYFVNSPATSNGVTTIYDKNTSVTGLQALAMDEYDVTSVTKVTSKGGKPTNATLASIQNKNVVSVAVPYGTTEGTSVIISSANITGEVKSLDSDYTKITIGSTDYELSPYYEVLMAADPTTYRFEVGDNGKFYLDYLGRIVFMEKNESSDPYGLLVAYASNGGIDSATQLKIMTTGGKWLECTLKESVKVDGTSMTAAEAVTYLKGKCPTYDSSNENFIIQPVIYKLSGTTITAITTLDAAKAKAGRTYSNSGYAFKESGSTSFTMVTSGTNATEVFVVPSDIIDYSKYSNKSASYFSNNINYHVAAYEMTGTNAKIVVCYLQAGQTGGATIVASTPVYIVEEIGEAVNDEGQAVKTIKYTPLSTSGEQNELKTNDEAEVITKAESIQPGDLIKFITEDGVISDIKTVFVSDALTNDTGSWENGLTGHHIVRDGNTTNDSYYQAIYGTIYDYNEESKQFQIIPDIYEGVALDEGAYESLILGSTVQYYKYDTTGAKDILVNTSLGEVKKYLDFKGTDPAIATKALVIVIQNRVVGVYYVD